MVVALFAVISLSQAVGEEKFHQFRRCSRGAWDGCDGDYGGAYCFPRAVRLEVLEAEWAQEASEKVVLVDHRSRNWPLLLSVSYIRCLRNPVLNYRHPSSGLPSETPLKLAIC